MKTPILCALIVAVVLVVPAEGRKRPRSRNCRKTSVCVVRTKTAAQTKTPATCTAAGCVRPASGEQTTTKTTTKTTPTTKTAEIERLEQWAAAECRRMAAAGRVGHFGQFPRGARFVGCGRGGRTCMTIGTPKVVAHVAGYSVRVW